MKNKYTVRLKHEDVAKYLNFKYGSKIGQQALYIKGQVQLHYDGKKKEYKFMVGVDTKYAGKIPSLEFAKAIYKNMNK